MFQWVWGRFGSLLLPGVFEQLDPMEGKALGLICAGSRSCGQLDRFPGLRNCSFCPERFTCFLMSNSDLQSGAAGEQVTVAGEQLYI